MHCCTAFLLRMSSDYSASRTRSLVSCAMYRMVDLPQTHFKLFIDYRSPKNITYKIATITHLTLRTQQAAYLAEPIHESTPVRSLRSSGRYLLHQPTTNTVTVSCAFAVAAPRIWNSLSVSVTACINHSTFKTKFKTYLFST